MEQQDIRIADLREYLKNAHSHSIALELIKTLLTTLHSASLSNQQIDTVQGGGGR